MRRFAESKVEHFDSLVFWARDHFDQCDCSLLVRTRFENMCNIYEDNMKNFVSGLSNAIHHPVPPNKSVLETRDEFIAFFLRIQRLVNQIIQIAETMTIPRRSVLKA